jgi:hypothetical protein
MIIKVTDTQTANKLNDSMASGNCIVLYHMHGCPYCVQMMPDWANFMQLAKQQMPDLTIGEVERTHMDKLGAMGVSSFPTIKFYKAGNMTTAQQQTTMNTSKQNSFKALLKGIMGQMPAASTPGDNSVMFEDTRSTDKLIKFARDNLVKDLNTKGKKTKKTKKHAVNTLAKLKKTKKQIGKKPIELTNSLARLSVANSIGASLGQNANMMDLPKYKKAKKADAKTAKKLKKQILG